MKGLEIFGFSADNGGRRKIKDRRYWVNVLSRVERRTGLRRRSGLPRRVRPLPVFDKERRQADSER